MQSTSTVVVADGYKELMVSDKVLWQVCVFSTCVSCALLDAHW